MKASVPDAETAVRVPTHGGLKRDPRFVGDLSERGPTRVRVSRLRQAVTIPALLCLCLLAPLAYVLARAMSPRAADAVVRWFHRSVLRLFNLRLTVRGQPAAESPLMFVANHASYIDVFVLGALVRGYFVAKAEVSNWPVLGKLAGLQRTVFIDRDPRRTASQLRLLRERLAAGDNLIVFPEGTSSDGARVLPFRPSLFAAATDPEPVPVQPVSVVYRDYEGRPMAPADRDFYAWYLPMTFLPHFLNGLGTGAATVEVCFHAVRRSEVTGNRKTLAADCGAQVAAEVEAVLARAAPASDLAPVSPPLS
ncbi:MAG: lysophospholipid acyltransferase family protein [Pseudomonadota bacterium]